MLPRKELAGESACPTLPVMVPSGFMPASHHVSDPPEMTFRAVALGLFLALVAGAIFTIPAFMMVEIDGQHLWANLRQHYWQSVLILLVGGLIGVCFIVVLRRPLCVETDLPFPESVACAEVVKSGQQGGDAPKFVFGSMAFAGLLQ